ncbi:hypothetical protein [Nocardiopsis baichengensis]|uniref:hypothetical protein n=1 Tax=Nocardiopsis baichengensis TaxID=280240 RepID=UPI00034828F8|nr:hypothetical protein [Nocardiopsis baichengensis]
MRHNNTRYTEARALMRARWQACEQSDGDRLPWEQAEALLADVFDHYTPVVR